MSGDVLGVVGVVLAALLGGGTAGGFWSYLRDRRKDRGEHAIGTFGSLEKLNDRLTTQVAELQTRLDEERTQRRELEDEVAAERRFRRALEETVEVERRARHVLEERIAELERRAGPEEEN